MFVDEVVGVADHSRHGFVDVRAGFALQAPGVDPVDRRRIRVRNGIVVASRNPRDRWPAKSQSLLAPVDQKRATRDVPVSKSLSVISKGPLSRFLITMAHNRSRRRHQMGGEQRRRAFRPRTIGRVAHDGQYAAPRAPADHDRLRAT